MTRYSSARTPKQIQDLHVSAVENMLVGPVLRTPTAPRDENGLSQSSRARLLELLQGLLDAGFVSREEFDFLWMVTEKQLIVEGAARALKRHDKYYFKKRDILGDSIDWTDDKSVFKERT